VFCKSIPFGGIIADNGGTDGSQKSLKEWALDRVVEVSEKEGYGSALLRGTAARVSTPQGSIYEVSASVTEGGQKWQK